MRIKARDSLKSNNRVKNKRHTNVPTPCLLLSNLGSHLKLLLVHSNQGSRFIRRSSCANRGSDRSGSNIGFGFT